MVVGFVTAFGVTVANVLSEREARAAVAIIPARARIVKRAQSMAHTNIAIDHANKQHVGHVQRAH